jgi:hypothetical protein
MCKAVLTALLSCSIGGVATEVWAQSGAEPLLDISRESRTGAAPSPSSVEKALTACLKGIEAEYKSLKTVTQQQKEARKAEEEGCFRARRQCISNPSSADCKGFVIDYSE